jgi:uncharacterized protein (TIGR02246 family)
MDAEVRALYERLLTAWNNRDAQAFASHFVEQGHLVGFDGSQADSAREIQAHLSQVFANHPTAAYVALLHTTPAAFHGRPELVQALTDELSALLPA